MSRLRAHLSKRLLTVGGCRPCTECCTSHELAHAHLRGPMDMDAAANRHRFVPVRGKRRRVVEVVAAASTAALALAACSSGSSGGGGSGGKTGTITVAVVDNPLMSTIEKLTPAGFEASHPGVKVKF